MARIVHLKYISFSWTVILAIILFVSAPSCWCLRSHGCEQILQDEVRKNHTVFSQINLANFYIESKALHKAFECLSNANECSETSLLESNDLVLGWEDLLSPEPLNSDYHLGLGIALEKQDKNLIQAVAHYKQAFVLSAGHPTVKLKRAMSHISRLETTVSRRTALLTGGQLSNGNQFDSFLNSISVHWCPSVDNRRLLTRCRVYVTEKLEIDQAQVIVSSGSQVEDNSVLKSVQEAPFGALQHLCGSGIYDFLFVSDGEAKIVDCSYYSMVHKLKSTASKWNPKFNCDASGPLYCSGGT